MRAAIFDFDGVVVDSEPLHFEALRAALRPEGIEIDVEEYDREYLALDDRGAIRTALARHRHSPGFERVAAIAERKARLFAEMIDEIELLPGVESLARALAAEMPVAIASGALHAEIERILAAHGLRAAFCAIVGADDVQQTKPHPEPYLAAMRGMARHAPGLAPLNCLVIEDSMTGIAAGLAAGMKVLAVTNSYPAERLTAAHRVLPSLAGLRPDDLRAIFRA
ncbi:MAG: HAD family hydrolase [Vicinamibacteria bacterium]